MSKINADPCLFAEFLEETYRKWLKARLAGALEVFQSRFEECGASKVDLEWKRIEDIMHELAGLEDLKCSTDSLIYFYLSALAFDAEYKEEVKGATS